MLIPIPILIDNKIGYLDGSIRGPQVLACGIHENEYFTKAMSTANLLRLDNPDSLEKAKKKLYVRSWEFKDFLARIEKRIDDINFSLLILDKFIRDLIFCGDHVGFLCKDKYEDGEVICKTLGISRYGIALGREVDYQVVRIISHDYLSYIETKRDVRNVKKILTDKMYKLKDSFEEQKKEISDIDYTLSRINEMQEGILHSAAVVENEFFNQKPKEVEYVS